MRQGIIAFKSVRINVTSTLFQDYIIEKVKKIGGFTTFNNFIMKELEIMYKLLSEIKTTLTVSGQAGFSV